MLKVTDLVVTEYHKDASGVITAKATSKSQPNISVSVSGTADELQGVRWGTNLSALAAFDFDGEFGHFPFV